MLIDLAVRLGEASTRSEMLRLGAATLSATLGRPSAWSSTVGSPTTPSCGDVATGVSEALVPVDRRHLSAHFPGLATRLVDKDDRFVVLPLVVDAEPAGAIGVVWDGSPSVDDEARDVICTVGRLVSQRLRWMAARAREHELAQQLQLSLLPVIVPIPGFDVEYRYHPAGEGALAGGDFYDVVDLGPGGVAVVIGDVAGHGVEAAAASGEVRYLTRGMLEHTRDPAAVIQLVDKALDRSRRPITMVTLLCALIDTEHDELRIASAGHGAPVLRRAAGAAEVATLVPAPPLGAGLMSGSAPPIVSSVPFRLGDLAVFYTDGLVESRSRPIDEMVELVRAIAAQHGSPRELCTRLEALGAEEDARGDDLALLVVGRRGGDGPLAHRARADGVDDGSGGVRPDRKGV
jgi:hypothetical protein